MIGARRLSLKVIFKVIHRSKLNNRNIQTRQSHAVRGLPREGLITMLYRHTKYSPKASFFWLIRERGQSTDLPIHARSIDM